MNGRIALFFVVLVGVVLVIGLAIGACSPKEQSRWIGESFTFSLGEIPSDVCLVGGNPLVLNATTESDGDFNLVYVRNNGDIVIRHWARRPIAQWEIYEAGEFYWRGGRCPAGQ